MTPMRPFLVLPDRGPHSGLDHLDHGDRVAFACIAEHRRRCGVAGDHEHLHALVDEVVEDLERVAPHVGDRLRAVGRVGGVADVDHGLGGELVD